MMRDSNTGIIHEIDMNIDGTKISNKDDSSVDYSCETNSEAYLQSYRKKRSLNNIDNIDNNNNSCDEENFYKIVKNYALMNKFLKEQNIYSDPKDYYKRRTITIIRKQNNFGFDLQSYGLLNLNTKHVEYIFYVSNVIENSAAFSSGLRTGDVVLAINGIKIEEFKDLNKIIKYVKEKNAIRLIILSENICKKIDYQKRINQLQKKISDKLSEYNTLCKEEEKILKKLNKNKIEATNKYDNETDLNKTLPILDFNNLNRSPQSFRLSNDDNEHNNTSHRHSIVSTTSLSNNSSLFSPSSVYSADEVYNYNEQDSYDETEWIITRL